MTDICYNMLMSNNESISSSNDTAQQPGQEAPGGLEAEQALLDLPVSPGRQFLSQVEQVDEHLLKQLVDSSWTFQRLYNAVVPYVSTHIDHPLDLTAIGKALDISSDAVLLTYRKLRDALSELGVELPPTPKDPRWRAYMDDLVFAGYTNAMRQQRYSNQQNLAAELGISHRAVKQAMERLYSRGLITYESDERKERVLSLYTSEHMPPSEIALLLDLPEGTVRSILDRARRKIDQAGGDRQTLLMKHRYRSGEEQAAAAPLLILFRQEGLNYRQMQERLLHEFKLDLSWGQIAASIRNLIDEGEVDSLPFGHQPGLLRRTVWALMNENRAYDSATMRIILDLANIEYTDEQLKAARDDFERTDHSYLRLMPVEQFVAAVSAVHKDLVADATAMIKDPVEARFIVREAEATAFLRLPRYMPDQSGEYELVDWLGGYVDQACDEFLTLQRQLALAEPDDRDFGLSPVPRD